MPVHNLLEQILNDCGCRPPKRAAFVPKRKFGWNGSDWTSFEPVQTPGLRFENGPRRPAFPPPLDVTPGGQPASQFTWRTADGSSTPNRWQDTSRPEQPSYMTGKITAGFAPPRSVYAVIGSRQPVFLGIREDKNAIDLVREKATLRQ
jgi:hypothetical protein